jgi:hypothetical protein
MKEGAPDMGGIGSGGGQDGGEPDSRKIDSE